MNNITANKILIHKKDTLVTDILLFIMVINPDHVVGNFFLERLPVGFLIQKFGIANISLVGSILVPLGLLISVFANSIYIVLVGYGLVTAVGVSLTYVCSATILRQLCSGPYKKWLRICISLQSSCLSFAGFTYPYLIAYLNELYSLSGVFLIFTGILLNNACVHLLFFFSLKDQNNANDKKKQDIIDKACSTSNGSYNFESTSTVSTLSNSTFENSIFNTTARKSYLKNAIYTEDVTLTKFTRINEISHDVLPATDIVQRQTSETYTGLKKIKDDLFGHFSPAFLCVLIASSLSLGTEYSFLALYIDILEFKGFSNQLALNGYIPLQTFALLCRFVPGISNKLDTTWLLAVFSGCGAIGQVVIMFSFNYYLTLFGVGLSGMTLGGVVAAGTIEVANTVSKTRFPVAFGQILTGSGLVATSVAPLHGALRDTWGNYDIVLASTAVLQFVSAILFVISWFCKRKHKPNGVNIGA
ncbi:hypothetical protein ACF0H5_019512 [Mactra antiquata]